MIPGATTRPSASSSVVPRLVDLADRPRSGRRGCRRRPGGRGFRCRRRPGRCGSRSRAWVASPPDQGGLFSARIRRAPGWSAPELTERQLMAERWRCIEGPGGGDFRRRRRFLVSAFLRQELARLAAPARSARVVGSPTLRVGRTPGPSLQPQSSQYPHLEPVGRTLGSLRRKCLGLMVSCHVEVPTRVTPAVLGHHRVIMTRLPRERSARGAGRRHPSTSRRVSSDQFVIDVPT